MTYPNAIRIHHYNNVTWGPIHYYTSAVTGNRLIFRANEIERIAFNPLGGAYIHTVEGGIFAVQTASPEYIA